MSVPSFLVKLLLLYYSLTHFLAVSLSPPTCPSVLLSLVRGLSVYDSLSFSLSLNFSISIPLYTKVVNKSTHELTCTPSHTTKNVLIKIICIRCALSTDVGERDSARCRARFHTQICVHWCRDRCDPVKTLNMLKYK